MSIQFSILGEPGRDNGMLACVDTGQSQARLLFDCGEAVGYLCGGKPIKVRIKLFA